MSMCALKAILVRDDQQVPPPHSLSTNALHFEATHTIPSGAGSELIDADEITVTFAFLPMSKHSGRGKPIPAVRRSRYIAGAVTDHTSAWMYEVVLDDCFDLGLPTNLDHYATLAERALRGAQTVAKLGKNVFPCRYSGPRIRRGMISKW